MKLAPGLDRELLQNFRSFSWRKFGKYGLNISEFSANRRSDFLDRAKLTKHEAVDLFYGHQVTVDNGVELIVAGLRVNESFSVRYERM
jgi:hypothetical protein